MSMNKIDDIKKKELLDKIKYLEELLLNGNEWMWEDEGFKSRMDVMACLNTTETLLEEVNKETK